MESPEVNLYFTQANMNYVSLISSQEQQYASTLENVMKTFSLHQDFKSIDIKDLSDFPTIMKEGRIHELSKCIQNVLNCNLCSYTFPNNITIFDSSFVDFFQTAQLIIRFLLYWKSELLNEKLKIENHIQEIDKLRKDNALRKTEIRELRKQLANFLCNEYSNTSDTGIFECSVCKKLFVSCSFLYAHHKKRHEDQPFLLNRKECNVKSLQSEILSLKTQLTSINNKTSGMRNEDTLTKRVRMKVTPEVSCLETQEKFWRGKLKETSDKFKEEKEQLNNIIKKVKSENHELQEQISNLGQKTETVSTSVQTENMVELSDDFLKDTIQWSKQRNITPIEKTLFPDLEAPFNNYNIRTPLRRNSISKGNNDNAFENSQLTLKPVNDQTDKTSNIIDQVDFFLEKYNKNLETSSRTTHTYDEHRQEVKKVIAKLFTSDESSERLADKLFNIYDKRTTLESRDEPPLSKSTSLINGALKKTEPVKYEKENSANEVLYSNPTLTENNEITSTESETLAINSQPIVSPLSFEKQKSRILPFFRNIPSKILKNYSKSRKAIEDKVITKLSTSNEKKKANSKTEALIQVEMFAEQKMNELKLLSEDIKNSADDSSGERIKVEKSRPQLVSALKKSKSTGNIPKKVVFSDDLPTLRTSSESNLCGASYFDQQHSQFDNSIPIIAEVHINESVKPIPTPRTHINSNSTRTLKTKD